jgi:two-component system OmpR family response regulator
MIADKDGQTESGLHILVTEDDAAMRRLLRTLFEDEGYKVSEARTGKDVRQVLAREPVALITLDLGLQTEDGLAVARDIRRISDAPIIMVTAKSSDIDRVVGLEIGADDYIVKPFNTREVLARVRAVLRRTQPAKLNDSSPYSQLAFDDFILDVTGRALHRRDGRLIDLTTREFALLEGFVRRPRRVVSRDALLNLVGGDGVDALDRAIDTLVSRLRKKIELDPARPTLIKTVRGAGYIFATRVTPA